MRINRYTQVVLTAIALLLGVIAVRQPNELRPVFAQSAGGNYYIEPGVQSLRKPDGTAQLEGKVVVDLRTGDVYGFPTLTGGPYPVDPTKPEPAVSSPMYLGRFDFSKMHRPQ